MGNMITWNWPNWITVVLMAALGYLALSLVAQLVRRRGNGGAAIGIPGAGPSASQRNFAGVYGQSEFALPAAM